MSEDKGKNLEETRYGKFMTQRSFDLEVMYGRHFLKTDNVQSIWLHRINLIESKSHDLYGQAKPADKAFMDPVELNVMINIDDGEQYYYGDNEGGITRDDTGNLRFGVYLEELKEKNTEINRGDIIEYNMSGSKARYYEVESANMVEDQTSKTIGGFKPYWKAIAAVPIKDDVFPYLKDKK